VNQNLVEKSGSWFSYKGERIGQGRENARQFLRDNKDILARLDAEVRKQLGLAASGPAATESTTATHSAKVATMPTGTDAVKAPAARR
jgi:recombination protein RecA